MMRFFVERTIGVQKLVGLVGAAFCLTTTLHSVQSQTPQEVFSEIYQNGVWGRNGQGQGISGMGSVPENAVPYLDMLQKFIAEHQIRSVVDVGCGDWELSKVLNWGSIEYYGYDAAEAVIQNNKVKYGTPRIHFQCCDAIHTDLPKADLLICKDVLQHLPNSYIHDFIAKLGNYKFCLITNDIAYEKGFRKHTNKDIPMGSGRCVNLAKKPFLVKGTSFYKYLSDGHTKEVFLVQR